MCNHPRHNSGAVAWKSHYGKIGNFATEFKVGGMAAAGVLIRGESESESSAMFTLDSRLKEQEGLFG